MFSLAFRDPREGVIVGGDFTAPTTASRVRLHARRRRDLDQGGDLTGYRSGVDWVTFAHADADRCRPDRLRHHLRRRPQLDGLRRGGLRRRRLRAAAPAGRAARRARSPCSTAERSRPSERSTARATCSRERATTASPIASRHRSSSIRSPSSPRSPSTTAWSTCSASCSARRRAARCWARCSGVRPSVAEKRRRSSATSGTARRAHFSQGGSAADSTTIWRTTRQPEWWDSQRATRKRASASASTARPARSRGVQVPQRLADAASTLDRTGELSRPATRPSLHAGRGQR